jgi:hypothetical protein
MFSNQMIEIFEDNPIIYNKNTSFIFWMILYTILLIYPYQDVWYVPYLLIMMYLSLVIIIFKVVNSYILNDFMI